MPVTEIKSAVVYQCSDGSRYEVRADAELRESELDLQEAFRKCDFTTHFAIDLIEAVKSNYPIESALHNFLSKYSVVRARNLNRT